MSATTHPVAPEEIMALLDGELSSDRAQSVSPHMDDCAECREIAGSLRNTSQSVAKWTIPAAPVGIEDRLLQSTANIRKPSQDGFIESLRRLRRHRPSLAWGGAALVVLFLFFGLTSSRHETSMPEAMKAARMRAAEQEAAAHQAGVDNAMLAQKMPRGIALEKAKGDLEVSHSSRPLNGRVQRGGGEYKVPLAPNPSEPMIARTVSLSIVAEKDFDGARASLDKILARHNGYAASLNVSTPQGAARSLQASLRIPAPRLAAALAELKALGHVENETQNGEEVTQQHADLVARLKNSRETEQRLQAILVQRTGKISDVLEVEQEIARVRGEIEQMEAEQKALEHRVDFATIDLKLSEEYKAKLDSPAPSASTQLHNASVNGYRNVVDTLLALLLFFAEYGPVLLLWAMILFTPAWFVWRRWRRAAATV